MSYSSWGKLNTSAQQAARKHEVNAINSAINRTLPEGTGRHAMEVLSPEERVAHNLINVNKITQAEFKASGVNMGWRGGREVHISDWAAHGEAIASKREHGENMRDLKQEHKLNMNNAKNHAELSVEQSKLAAEHDILVKEHIENLKWKNTGTLDRMSHRWNKVKGINNVLSQPGEWMAGKVKTGAKWGLIGGGVAVAAGYLMRGKNKPATPAGEVEQEAAAAAPAMEPVMTADAMMPTPIGMGPKGPIYGEHTARASGMGEENKAIPPRMTAGAFEDAGSAAQRLANKDTSGQPSLAV